MKPLLFTLFLTLAAFLLSSCVQPSSTTLDYKKLDYDTHRIVIFAWDTTKYQFPKNSSPLPLSQNDFRIADSLLNNALDSINSNRALSLYESFAKYVPLDSFLINKQNYKHQYFPYEDVNGVRKITITSFNRKFDNWKTAPYTPRLHSGIKTLYFEINLRENSCIFTGDGGYG